MYQDNRRALQSMNLKIEVDTSRFKIDLDGIEKAISRELEDTAHKIERQAKELVPVDTGKLRSSIDASGSGMKYEITASTPYARHIEYGTRPHVITGNPDLVWEGQINGPVHMVHHPGNKAYKYMETACDAQVDGIDDRIAKAIDKAL